MSATEPATWLLLASAVHLGFQLTVDLVVYPALVDVPPARWSSAHERHSRRMVPLVALVYVPLVVLLAWVAVAEPGAGGTWLALLGGLLAVLSTAAVAAPLHGRLSTVPEVERPAMLRTLMSVDRVRTAGALLCAAGAVLLVLG